jgi:hypothetical protein
MTHCPSGCLRRIVSVGPERRIGPDTPVAAPVRPLVDHGTRIRFPPGNVTFECG